MAKKIKWTDEKYKLALRGDGMPGLRKLVDGFAASDGYDLRRIDQWSSSQKRRVRDYYERVRHLEAQERRIVFPRKKENLRALQEAFHGDIPSRKFRAAFIPYTDPTPLPGAKRREPKIRYTQKGIVIDAGPYRRRFEAFDKRMLVRDPDAEVRRVVDLMPRADVFFVQVGEYQTLNSRSAGLLASQVKQYMSKYDGKTPLPRSSGNYGDNPKAHHWKLWLNGIIGYEHNIDIDRVEMAKAINAGMKAAKARRAEQDKKMNRRKKSK